MRSQTRLFKLRRWFPPKDPIATTVATLCVLREDFMLELRGITADRLEELDGNERAYRCTYFWRNSLRTLEEIRMALNRLNRHAEFREALDREPGDVRDAFEELKKTLNRAAEEFLSDLRNTFGGHLDEPTIHEALEVLDPLHEGAIELSEIRGATHYRFALDVIWTTLLRDVAPSAYVAKTEEILKRSARLIPAVKAIDDVLACYIRTRGLNRR